MKVTEIVSSGNQRLKLIRSLAESGQRKDQAGDQALFLLEGQKLIQDALNKKIELIDVIVSRTYFDSGLNNTDLADRLDHVVVVQDRIFNELYTTDTSCGIIATVEQRRYQLADMLTGRLLLLGDNIQDPGNLGTIIRTAHAFQAGGLILSKGSVDCYNPKVVRSSMGAIFSLPIIIKADLQSIIDQLKAHKFHIIALDNKAKTPFWQETTPESRAYILGNEGHGISPDIKNLVDKNVSIPISPDCESLNVAVAAGIILSWCRLPKTNQ